MKIKVWPDPPLHATRHCRHYSYNPEESGPTCALGVYLGGRGDALKCMPDNMRDDALLRRGNVAEPCDFRQEYTPEEREAWSAWSHAMVARSLSVHMQIPKEGQTGQMECPECMIGTVRWTRSSNGHIWATCSTPHCSQIIQ